MDALGNGGGFWWWQFSPRDRKHRPRRRPNSSSSSSESIDLGERGWFLADFPLKQASIAASLTLTGDTVAQLRDRFLVHARRPSDSDDKKGQTSLPLELRHLQGVALLAAAPLHATESAAPFPS